MSQGCKDHENLCVYDQYTLHVDVDVAPDYSQEKKTRRRVAQDRAASIGRQLAQRRRQELLEHARGGAKYAVRRFPARRERARARACPRAATRTLPARNNAKRGVLFSEIVRERARDANFARTQQCEAWRFIFGDCARARAGRELCPHATMRSVADSGNIMEICWKYAGNILIYHNLRRELGRTLPARNNPKRCGYDLYGIVQK